MHTSGWGLPDAQVEERLAGRGWITWSAGAPAGRRHKKNNRTSRTGRCYLRRGAKGPIDHLLFRSVSILLLLGQLLGDCDRRRASGGVGALFERSAAAAAQTNKQKAAPSKPQSAHSHGYSTYTGRLRYHTSPLQGAPRAPHQHCCRIALRPPGSWRSHNTGDISGARQN